MVSDLMAEVVMFNVFTPRIQILNSNLSLGPSDYRTISLENSILPQVNGSSRVKISNAFDIICSIKVTCEFFVLWIDYRLTI